MKGILQRDIEYLRSSFLWMMPVLIVVFFALPEAAMQLVGIMWGMYFLMMLIWLDQSLEYAFCLPWKRWQIVGSRMLWASASAVLALVGSAAGALVYLQLSSLLMGVYGFAVLLFSGSVLVALNFCVPGKGKIAADIAAMVALATWAISVGAKNAAQWSITGAQLGWMVLGSIAAAAVAFGVSVKMIYRLDV